MERDGERCKERQIENKIDPERQRDKEKTRKTKEQRETNI
jgi:hypothetical protein